jgi:hypothetical protein
MAKTAQSEKAAELRADPMMAHLMDALEAGKDIGHYGRLVFVMVAHHFLDENELVSYLMKDKDCDEQKARALVSQVKAHDYNPPRRERILEWMQQQEFPICPNAEDPDGCNVYKHLNFPNSTYEHISDYQTAKVHSEE